MGLKGEKKYLRILSTTKSAFGAAVLGLAFSLVEAISNLVSAAWQDVIPILGDLRWSFIGMIILFSILIFKPEKKNKGLMAVLLLCGIQTLLLLAKIYLLFSWFHEELGSTIYFVFLELVVPIALMVFAAFMQYKPEHWGGRYTSLATVLAFVISVVYQVLLLGNFDVFTIVGSVSAGFVAQWFWVLFMEWKIVDL